MHRRKKTATKCWCSLNPNNIWQLCKLIGRTLLESQACVTASMLSIVRIALRILSIADTWLCWLDSMCGEDGIGLLLTGRSHGITWTGKAQRDKHPLNCLVDSVLCAQLASCLVFGFTSKSFPRRFKPKIRNKKCIFTGGYAVLQLHVWLPDLSWPLGLWPCGFGEFP